MSSPAPSPSSREFAPTCRSTTSPISSGTATPTIWPTSRSTSTSSRTLSLWRLGRTCRRLASAESKAKFKDSFDRLLAALKSSGRPAIFVRSCFWAEKTRDEIMQKACLAAGGVFVNIGALGKDPSNAARSERNSAHAGVAAHPGDKGMKAIADALLKAMTSRRRE